VIVLIVALQKDDGKKSYLVSLSRNWFLVQQSTGTLRQRPRIHMRSHGSLIWFSRISQSTSVNGNERAFSSRRASSRCTITVFPRILITRRMRREKPSRALRGNTLRSTRAGLTLLFEVVYFCV